MKRAAPIGQRESIARRTARHSGVVLRFSRRHGGSLVSWTGVAGLTVCGAMWAVTGTTYLLTGVVCLGGALGGAAVAHHQRNRVINGPNSRRPGAHEPTWREKDRAEDAMREGRQPEWDPGNRTVVVTSHARDGAGVRSHTRAAPGQAKQPPNAPFAAGGGTTTRTRPASGTTGGSSERNWGGESGWGEPVPGFGGKWIKGDTDVTGRPLSEHERRNERDYAEWRANPNAPGDYWDHQRGRAITSEEMDADRKGRWSWQHRHSVFQDERTGVWTDAWDRPVDDPDVHRDRSQPGDDPESWT